MTLALTELERRVLDEYQRGFPLSPTPYADVAAALGVSEPELLETLDRLARSGALSRVGAVLRPRAVGVSTLAAMAVPRERLDEIAALVNGYSEINHNYEREHELNIWFVATAAHDERLSQVLAEIETRAGLPVHRLPMLDDYHIDLGFKLQWT
jgi:DNA-binding Lrp family transcriptional regulator